MQRRRPPGDRGRRRSRPIRPRTYKIVCSGCGKEIMCPIPPPADKELLCLECFRK